MTVDPVPRVIDAAEWERAGGRAAAAGPGPQRLPARRLRRPADLRRRGDPAAAARDAPPATSRGCGGCSTRPCHRRPWPASTSSGARTAPCWFWRTICGCPLEPATPPPSAKRSSRRSAPRCGRGRSTSYAGRARRRDPRRRPRRARRAGGGDRLRRARQRRLVRAQPARPRARDPGGARPGELEVERGRLFARHNRERHQLDVALPPPRRGPPQRPGRQPDRARRAADAGAGVGPAALRQRLRHRPRRRQARPRLRREHGPLLPRRGAAAALGPQLRPLRRGRSRGGDGAARRAGDQAARRLRRQGRDDHAASDRAAAAAGDRAGAPAPRRLHRPGDRAALQPPDGLRGPAAAAPGRPAALRRQRRRRRLARWLVASPATPAAPARWSSTAPAAAAARTPG